MLYGYIRFTVGDNQDNSLEAQTNLLKKNGCNNIYVEDSECTAAYHPVFESLILNILKKDDTLVVSKADRFAHSIIECVSVIQYVFNKGARINILNIGLLDNTDSGNLCLAALKAAVELEKYWKTNFNAEYGYVNHSQRKKIGRPTLPDENMLYALELLKTKTYREASTITGISRSSLARALKRLSVKKKDWK